MALLAAAAILGAIGVDIISSRRSCDRPLIAHGVGDTVARRWRDRC